MKQTASLWKPQRILLKSLFSTLVLALVIMACQAPRPSASTADRLPDMASKEELLSRAHECAKAELARLSAAEMMYRNHPYFYVQVMRQTSLRTSLYAKRYRHFRDYDILDVRRTSSLLRPVEFVIEYTYDVLGTTGIRAQGQNIQIAQEALKDTVFSIKSTNSITRNYSCDATGSVITEHSPDLERPNYWDFKLAGTLFKYTTRESPLP